MIGRGKLIFNKASDEFGGTIGIERFRWTDGQDAKDVWTYGQDTEKLSLYGQDREGQDAGELWPYARIQRSCCYMTRILRNFDHMAKIQGSCDLMATVQGICCQTDKILGTLASWQG